MAIKDARNVETKKRTHTDASSSVAMAPAETSPHAANQVQPPPLPPGVYFSPTPMECLGLLNRSIAGDKEMRDTLGYIVDGDVYGESPDALRRRHPRASIRDREHSWWFLSQTKFQSETEGGGASKRSARSVMAGGNWKLEQSKEKLEDDGFKNCFGYYVDGNSKSKKKIKTPWLMQEFTSAHDDGAGKGGVPALYRVYVTPHATDNQLRGIFGEDGVKHGPDGEKKPARVMVPAEYFDRIAAMLPEGSVRGGVGQEHVQAPPLPPVALEGLPDDFYSQQFQYQYQQQQDEYQYEQQQGAEDLPDDFYIKQEQYLGEYYDQQQEPLSVIAPPLPPPASPGLLVELAASENLSMPMADLMSMLDDFRQPAEPAKGEEPNWDSLDDIIDDDELASFNKEG
ncbi:unnamed protein product [Alopecurus aequalis]